MPLSARLWSGLAFTAFWASVGSAAAPKSEEPKPPEFTDVTQRVDVEFVEGLRSPEATTHEVFVVLKNKSGAPLKGPLAVVFDNAKTTDFSFDWYTDTLADGQQYYGLVDLDDELPAKQTSRRRKLYLKTAAGVDDAQRATFQAPLRVVQLTPEHVDSKKPVDEVVEGKKYDRKEFDRVKEIQERAAKHLFETHKDGVCGVFLGEDDNGNLNILVSTARRGVSREIPGTFEGVDLSTQVVGGYRRFDGPAPATAKASPTVAKPSVAPLSGNRRSFIDRPICIGVSGINITDVCASGTIGCRVKDQIGNLYALSNNHVFAEQAGFEADGTATGGAAVVGDVINQPSPGEDIITPCGKPPGFFLGTLAAWEPLRYVDTAAGIAPPNVIDSAIASVTAQNMGFAAPTDTYGAPSRQTVLPKIKLKIQKMGRTTGWTKGQIDAINGFVTVSYDDGPVRFSRAIITKNVSSGTFGAPGDSGSLVVTQSGNNPVALLFAGSVGIDTVFCPITVALDRFNVTVDDGSSTYNGGHSGRIGTAIGPVNRGIRR